MIYAAESAAGVLEKENSTFVMSTIRGGFTSPCDLGELLDHENWSMGKHRTFSEISELRSLLQGNELGR